MGRGNFTARGNNEGQYYVPNELFEYYWKPGEDEDEDMSRSCAELWKQGVNLDEDGWEFDEARTSMEWQDILINFMEDFAKKFPSFQRLNDCTWVESHGAEGRAILENNLFYIAIADNETSMAVILFEKEDAPECFQARHCDSYLGGIKECLLNSVPYINFRTSAWTQGTITREEFRAHKVKQAN